MYYFSSLIPACLCCSVAGVLIELQTLLSVGLSPATVKQFLDDFGQESLVLQNADLGNGMMHSITTYYSIFIVAVRENCCRVSLKCSQGQ